MYMVFHIARQRSNSGIFVCILISKDYVQIKSSIATSNIRPSTCLMSDKKSCHRTFSTEVTDKTSYDITFLVELN